MREGGPITSTHKDITLLHDDPRGGGRLLLAPLHRLRFDPHVVADLKAARVWAAFRRLPPLYQRVRASNLAFYRTRYPEPYQRMLEHTVETAKAGKTFGDWTDYGRLAEE